MTDPVSPLAPKGGFPALPVIDGVDFAAIEAGVRYSGRSDVMLARMIPGTVIAGVFTKSSTRAAPILDCQAKIGGSCDAGAAIIVNSGNANAFTGRNGIEAVKAVTNAVASELSIPETRVFSSSTGVIGEPLKHERITAKIAELHTELSPVSAKAAAHAIMTTDTFAKGASSTCGNIKIAGFAKGSGMIAPDMATMLVYIFTDARISQALLQSALASLTNKTFNCITVDSDTSTSDALLVAATGTSGEITSLDDEGGRAFVAALHDVMTDLSHQVIRDGEGATKFIEIKVTGAATDTEAHTIGMSIANSPLVKTAVAGEDPNWGRVVMAVGKSGAQADRDLLSISFGPFLIADKGWVSPDYVEDDAAAYMKGENIQISVDLGIAEGEATVWTCDLTHRYIEINADYRS